MPRRRHHTAPRPFLALERLEPRELLAYPPTVAEQVFLERLNDARANPAAYGQSIGLDLAGVAPSQPLAFSTNLIQAARDHSQDMNDRRYFDHVSPSGLDPGDRMRAQGFNWMSYGESIAAGYPGPDQTLSALIIDAGVPDLGHRRHLLAMDAYSRDHTQVGVGIVLNGSGPYRHYYTIDSGTTPDTRRFLTGVVMNDANGNGRYDAGEGLGGVTITVSGVGSFTTFDTGGFGIPVNAGTYTVTASGGALGGAVAQTVAVGASNVRLNFTPSTPPAPPATNYESAVRRLYQAALGRTPSGAEVALWLPVMQQPGGPTLVATAIERSHEARTRLVRSWYVTYLGRDAGGAEEQGWVAALLQGASDEQILAGILSSQEFYDRTGGLLGAPASDDTFVRILFQRFLGRDPSAGEVTAFIGNFVTLYGRGTSAFIVLNSAEYRGSQIVSYYFNILGRSTGPGQSEVDGWVNSGLELLSIRIGFEGSPEFVNRP